MSNPSYKRHVARLAHGYKNVIFLTCFYMYDPTLITMGMTLLISLQNKAKWLLIRLKAAQVSYESCTASSHDKRGREAQRPLPREDRTKVRSQTELLGPNRAECF